MVAYPSRASRDTCRSLGFQPRQRRFDWLARWPLRSSSQPHMVWTAKKRPIAVLFVAWRCLPRKRRAAKQRRIRSPLLPFSSPRRASRRRRASLVASRWYRPHQSCSESLEAHARGTGSDAARCADAKCRASCSSQFPCYWRPGMRPRLGATVADRAANLRCYAAASRK